MKKWLITYPLWLILIPCLVCVSSIHYGGFLLTQVLHLYLFEPLEIGLAWCIGLADILGDTDGKKPTDDR